MHVQRLFAAASLAALTVILVGCGSSEEPVKAPEGSTYYQGEMKSKSAGPTPGSAKPSNPATDQ